MKIENEKLNFECCSWCACAIVCISLKKCVLACNGCSNKCAAARPCRLQFPSVTNSMFGHFSSSFSRSQTPIIQYKNRFSTHDWNLNLCCDTREHLNSVASFRPLFLYLSLCAVWKNCRNWLTSSIGIRSTIQVHELQRVKFSCCCCWYNSWHKIPEQEMCLRTPKEQSEKRTNLFRE